MSYAYEIAVGCVAGSLLAGALGWYQHQATEAMNRDTATVQVQVLSKLAQSAGRRGVPVARQEDPWGTAYAVTREGEGVRVCSLGPDQRPGGGDDICYTRPGIE
ncbi:MAG TPA: hypothetical protein VFQ91_19665 [Bryobacteraceae bacterium]|nr:hypothetical protein [Bryobacteraceae bacterium]